MSLRIACAFILAASVGLPGHAFAAASSAPFGYTPDPAMQRETPAQLQARVRRSCISTQMQLQNAKAQRGCNCYASRVVRGLDATELAAYRASGIFNDSARSKAFAALDGCGLKRPS